MGRIHSEPSPGLAILAGTLGDALRMHAAQRMSFFFWFLFCYKALTDRLREAHGMDLGDSEGVSVKATHQIAIGLRRDDDPYWDFVKNDASVVERASTACGATDAAHYCNLGIKPSFMTKIDSIASPSTDPVAFKLLSMLEVAAGATRQLPRRVNIGPDRIVDAAHSKMARAVLDGEPPLTQANVKTYLMTCEREMTRYQAVNTRKGWDGLAACCGCYLDFYKGAKSCERPWTREGVPSMRRSQDTAECEALGLDARLYVANAV